MFWYDGWTTGKSTFPMPDTKNIESIYVEAESATVGSSWEVVEDTKASGKKYLTVKSGLNSPQAVPDGDGSVLAIPFKVTQTNKYHLFARVNCPSADDDSFWVKMDDGKFSVANGLGTGGWDWVQLDSFQLEPGEHSLTIAYREDGALLDKIAITTYPFGPVGIEALKKEKTDKRSGPNHKPLPRDDANSREAHKQLLQKTKQGQIDVYFQGDSITRRWGATDYPRLLAHWKKTFHGWNAANFAWGGDNTHHMLWRMLNGELDGISPKVICLLAGANNLPWTGSGNTQHVDDVVNGVKAIMAEFRSRFPEVPIVLTAMFPRDQNAELASTITAINEKLESISQSDKRIHWININSSLVDSNGKLLQEVSSDGLHLDLAGYEIWASELRPVLNQIIGAPAKEDQSPPPTGNPGL